MSDLTVLDFFCGAGGFSEGFRQQGFKIVMGIDKWRPAIETFNYNFNLNCEVRDMLSFKGNIRLIEDLPDTHIILGSPPCVSFSSSNKSGKADKSMGVTLSETFLKIVAVKKHKPNSILKAWFMENVAKSKSHLSDQYTFIDLGLEEWARANNKDPNSVAISLLGNSTIINSANYGTAQSRKRLITGEVIRLGRLRIPSQTNCEENHNLLPKFKTLKFIRDSLPAPNEMENSYLVQDPNYPHLRVVQSQLSDQFYDTGLYACEWKNSRFLKVNHPYMGLMSFPENEDKPSRTITATKIGTSREAIIYKSEYNRIGDGEYRTPTVREVATIMGFPLTFQFLGTEGGKWRLVGNAVCPCVSRSLASVVREELLLRPIDQPKIEQPATIDGIPNLNDFKEKKFNAQPRRTIGSRFRRHPFKEGNITVTLSNYNIVKNEKEVSNWLTSVQYGNGEGFPSIVYSDGFYLRIESEIEKLEKGPRFMEIINNGFSERIANGKLLQKMHEERTSVEPYLEPADLVDKIASIIEKLEIRGEFHQNMMVIFPNKERIPQKQVLALYAINKVCTIANGPVEVSDL